MCKVLRKEQKLHCHLEGGPWNLWELILLEKDKSEYTLSVSEQHQSLECLLVSLMFTFKAAYMPAELTCVLLVCLPPSPVLEFV